MKPNTVFRVYAVLMVVLFVATMVALVVGNLKSGSTSAHLTIAQRGPRFIPPADTVTTTLSDDQRINNVIHNESICHKNFYQAPTDGSTLNAYNFGVGGCDIDLGPGIYDLKSSIQVDRAGVRIRCARGTILNIKRGTVPAFVDTGGLALDGCWVMARYDVRDLPIGTAVVPLFDGRSAFKINDSTFDGATGDCIYLLADATLHSIADGWRLTNSSLLNCGGSGIYLHGGDANTGIAMGNLADHTCQADDKHSPRPKVRADGTPQCAGFADDGYLGDTFIMNQAQKSGYGYLSLDENARNLFLNNYSEDDEHCGVIKFPATWIGGLCSVQSAENIWTDGGFKARYLYEGPWMTLHQMLGSVPATTEGHTLGETVDILQPWGLAGTCTKYRLLPYPGKPPRWTCVEQVVKSPY